MNMALLPSTRISLKFNDISNYECWFLVDHQKIPSVSVLQQQINNRFYNNVKGKIILTLKGSLIPSWESSLILRDNDQIIVQKEKDNIEQKYFGIKKKPKKFDCSLRDKSVPEKDSFNDDIIFIPEKKCEVLDNSNKEYSVKKKHKIKKRKENQEVEYLEEIENEGDNSGRREKKKKKEYSEWKVKGKTPLEKKAAKQKKWEGEEYLEHNEHGVKKRKKEIEVYDPILMVIEPKRKKKKKLESRDDIQLVKLDVEDSPEMEAEQIVDKQQGKVEKLNNKLSKHQSNVCDEYKEIVIDDDDDDDDDDDEVKVVKLKEEEEMKADFNDEDIISDINQDNEILIDDDGESAKVNLVEDSCKITDDDSSKIKPVMSICISENSVELQQIDDSSKKSKFEQKERNSISQMSPHTIPRQNDSPNVSDIYAKEAIEVYDISSESLATICKAIKDGETLTIKEKKMKKIEFCPNVNENKSSGNESQPTNNDSVKNGSKSHRRRPRKRRHGPSFACAPFIQAMGSHSQSDITSMTSTPKATVAQPLSNLSSSRNNSDKHIHFESDNEDEGTISSITSSYKEPNHETSTFLSYGCQVQSLKSEKSSISGDTKPQTPFKNSTFSVRDSLLKNPGIYQRRVKSVKPSSVSPTMATFHSDKQQTGTLSENEALTNKDPIQSNISLSKPNYDDLPSLSGSTPRTGDKIAFKRLEIGIDYSPVVSDYQEATVLTFEEETKMITLKFHSSHESRESKHIGGKFEVCFEDEEVKGSDEDIETVSFSTLMEVKLLSKS